MRGLAQRYHEANSIVHAELAVNAPEVGRNRVLAEPGADRDLLVRQSGADHVGNQLLSGAEHGPVDGGRRGEARFGMEYVDHVLPFDD